MTVSLILVAIPVLGLGVFVLMRRKRDRNELEQHCLTAEALHALLEAKQELLIFDVRQPLDLLAYPEVIP